MTPQALRAVANKKKESQKRISMIYTRTRRYTIGDSSDEDDSEPSRKHCRQDSVTHASFLESDDDDRKWENGLIRTEPMTKGSDRSNRVWSGQTGTIVHEKDGRNDTLRSMSGWTKGWTS